MQLKTNEKLLFRASLVLLFCGTVSLFTSCSSEVGDSDSNLVSSLSTHVDSLDNPYIWDESYHPRRTRSTNEAYEFVPNGLTGAKYLGEILNGNDFMTKSFLTCIAGIKLDSIDICFDMPGYYCKRIYPCMAAYEGALNEALKSPDFSGDQTEEFEYDFKRFSYYDELKLAFGANFNIASLLNISASCASKKITHKTGLFARVFQQNFTAVMDYPEDGNLFKNNNDLNNHLTDAYINSIIYGRLAIISMESDYSYDSVKTAFKAALAISKNSGGASLDAQYKKILDTADVHVYILGGDAKGVAHTFQSFEDFEDFIKDGGVFSKMIPGVPIFITANHLNDNSAWVSQFEIPDD
jgi:thiol-activated cytolysin